MEKDVLSEVIEVEKEIQQCLDEEKHRSKEWVLSVRNELEARLAREQEEMTSSADEKLNEACVQARAEAQSIVRGQEERASLLAPIPDSILREIIVRHLHTILPE
ncbi:MAG: hypothetical protein ACWGN7_06820 [Thermodesulfovibrionales bacterium]